MTVYKITINLQMLLNDRSGYPPDLAPITEDIFFGITGYSSDKNYLKRDAKIIDYNIMSERE